MMRSRVFDVEGGRQRASTSIEPTPLARYALPELVTQGLECVLDQPREPLLEPHVGHVGMQPSQADPIDVPHQHARQRRGFSRR